MFGNCCGGSKQDKKLSFNYETAVKEREKSSYEITMSTIVSDRGALSQKCQFHPPIVSNINFFPGINVECYQIKKISEYCPFRNSHNLTKLFITYLIEYTRVSLL